MKKILLGILLSATAFASSYSTKNVDFVDGIQSYRSYIKNGTFEREGLKGWATYANTAQATPVSGTGGSPTHITLARNTSTPLRGLASMQIVNSGSTSAQGEGASYNFSIDTADQGKQMQVTFDYSVASGTIVGGSSATSVGDLNVYLYDVTNSQVIQPAGFLIQGSVAGQQYHQAQTTFQTNSNSTSYRLIFHVASTNTSAWTLNLDSLEVGPQITNTGAPVTDWASFTPTGSWTTNTTYTGQWRRVGDSMDLDVFISLSGAPTSATLTVNIPFGASIDTTKLSAGTSQSQANGESFISASSSYIAVVPTYNTATNIRIVYASSIGALGVVTQSTPITFGTGNSIHFTARFPIVGWSSNVLLSNTTSSQVVAASYYQSSGSNTPGANAQINFDTKVVDTNGAVTTGAGAWKFTAPLPGNYVVQVVASSASNSNITLYKNGSSYARLTVVLSTVSIVTGATTVFLNAGDFVDVRTESSVAVVGGTAPQTTAINISKVSGPSQIAAADTVAARYTDVSSTTLTTSPAKISFANKTKDTNSAYNSGTYTIPTPGWYHVSGQLLMSQTPALNDAAVIYVYKNGSEIKSFLYRFEVATATVTNIAVEDDYYFVAGDTVEIWANSASTSLSIANSTTRNIFSIVKVAN